MTSARSVLVCALFALLAINFVGAATAHPLSGAVLKPAVEHVCQHDTLVQTVIHEAQSAVAEVKKAHDARSAPVALQIYEIQSSSSSWKPIRIGIFFADLDDSSRYCTAAGQTRPSFDGGSAKCSEDDILTAEKKDILIKYLIPGAMKLHEDRLLVKPISGVIVVPDMRGHRICNQFTIPSSHQTSGVSGVDFIAYVAAGPTSGNVVAWALTCGYFGDGRPAVGAINVSPKYITTESSTVRVVAHEILHALGFNYNMFASQKMVSAVPNLRGKPRAPVVSSPNVLRQAKEQYGCTTAPGMELEDEGGSGTAYSHWKRRNALDEIMSGISGIGYYTALTIAAMEDTGYYKGNYVNAETMTWGKNAGCKLLNSKCVINGVSQESNMFYSQSVSVVCPSDRLGIGYVQIGQYTSDLPSYYQYFSDPTMGGIAQLVDYCPIVQSYGNTGCSTGDASIMVGSVISPNSRCLSSPTLKLSGYSGNMPAVCVQVKCNETTRNYQVQVHGANQFVDCPAGQEIQPSSHSKVFASGSIQCPLFEEVCQLTPQSSKAGDGVTGRLRPWAGVISLMLFATLSLSA